MIGIECLSFLRRAASFSHFSLIIFRRKCPKVFLKEVGKEGGGVRAAAFLLDSYFLPG